ncbi:MAG: hypothetical protein HN975_08685, partial [Anaerolineae bacterium]|nr:hypothetical protein [Anaerolineae bacterium]
MKRKLFITSFLLLILSACSAGYSPDEARVVATNAALGTPPPPQYQTAAAVYAGLTPTPTPKGNTVDLAATMLYDQIAANATEQAIQQEQLKREAAMSATAISLQSTATYEAEIATANAAAQFATATHQAFIMKATASKDAWNSQATATERSWSATATTDAVNHTLEVEARI